MKALQYNKFGGPEVLTWNEIQVPQPGMGEILITVKAATLNPTESKVREGYIKFPGSDVFPKTLGMDFSGIISKVGEGVTNFKIGDKVMGYLGAKGGSFADEVVADATTTFKIPAGLSFEEASTLPMNAATALKVVNSYLKPSEGKTILVNGASGGLGLFIVQYCKLQGQISGTVGGEEGMDTLKKLGIDDVIDFKKTDILKMGKCWDAILDTSGKLDFEDAKILLNENGEFSTMVPKGDPRQPGRTDGSKKENLVFAVPGEEEFKTSQQLAGEGKIKTFVGKTFAMKDAVDAITQFESGKLGVIGKCVLVNN